MSGTISYIDAWSLWFSGQEVDPQLRLWFMSILWWGRVGKIAAFIGGLTVILDLVGPERLRQWGRRGVLVSRSLLSADQPAERRPRVVDMLGIGVGSLGANVLYFNVVAPMLPEWLRLVLFVPVFIFSFIVAAIVAFAAIWIIGLLADELDRPAPARTIRIAAASLIFVGFHFDLLAS